MGQNIFFYMSIFLHFKNVYPAYLMKSLSLHIIYHKNVKQCHLSSTCMPIHYYQNFKNTLKVKSMQRSGTVAIRTQIQPSKPKREITIITNSQNTMSTYGQQIEQLFPKRWPYSNPNRTKTWNITETLTPKTGKHNHNKTTTLERSVIH